MIQVNVRACSERPRQSCASSLPQRAEVRHPVVAGDHGLAVDHERRRLEAESSVACGLQQLGVKAGVHVGLYLPNTPHYIIAFFSMLKAGGTVVNYSPLDAAAVLEHKIEDSRTNFLIRLDLAAHYPQMETMLGKTRLKKLIVGSLAEMTSAPDAVTAAMKAAKQLSEIVWDDRHVSFA